jgi:hypothetical protein
LEGPVLGDCLCVDMGEGTEGNYGQSRRKTFRDHDDDMENGGDRVDLDVGIFTHCRVCKTIWKANHEFFGRR